jgi:hypothetical protein
MLQKQQKSGKLSVKVARSIGAAWDKALKAGLVTNRVIAETA